MKKVSNTVSRAKKTIFVSFIVQPFKFQNEIINFISGFMISLPLISAILSPNREFGTYEVQRMNAFWRGNGSTDEEKRWEQLRGGVKS